MADAALDVPPFPPLRWDGYTWSGRIRLPSWAGYQSRLGAYAGESDDAPSDGTVGLSVMAPDNDPGRPLLPEQAAAFAHLLAHEGEVAAAVLRALVEHYGEIKGDYEDWRGEALPDVAKPDDLKTMVGLGTVHVTDVAKDGLAFVGFELGCDWDDEHGAGVMTHAGRVTDVGQADTSFSAWIDEDDEGEDEEDDEDDEDDED